MLSATVRAHPNIAFIKYWGNSNHQLKLPSNPSLSMNMDGLFTETSVVWDETIYEDHFFLDNKEETGKIRQRVVEQLDSIRSRMNIDTYAIIKSFNNFPMGAGIASSASAFAALTVAAFAAAKFEISERELTTIARLGSGSASRSIPTGFVQWNVGNKHEDSYAESFAAPDYWDIVDVIAVVSQAHKEVVSRQGHEIADTSTLQIARVSGATQRLEVCKEAILNHDFKTFADVVELDALLMHSVMMTSKPGLFYWLPATLSVMNCVRKWRADGLQICYTMDAGPNVHCICVRKDVEVVSNQLRTLSDVVDIRIAPPGGPASLIYSSK